MYDAIIVGARCAGSPTAMLLAQKGYRVLVVDRSTFPSDILSGHYIHQPGVERLKRWGLLDKIRASNCPPLSKMTFDAGAFTLEGLATPSGDVRESFAPRRRVLDKILVDAAVEAGAEMRENFIVEEILTEGGRVTGIRGRRAGGASVSEHARIVVGADGVRSLVARRVEAETYNVRPTLTCGYYSYWSGVENDGVELYPREGNFIVINQTNDGLSIISVLWPREEFMRVRSDIEGNFMRALDKHAPSLAARVRSRDARREERFYGTGDIPNFFRKSYGDGWALVGDAGYHKDAITAQGITDSFRQAEMLADALDEGFSERRPLSDALADYERRRDEEVMPMYDLTCQMAALALPPAEMRELLFALRGNQTEIDRFLGVVAGTTPIQEFYAPENMRRIIGAARLSMAA